MNDRKTHVIKYAHQLFVEKGFQATSIQDILDHSGISKGTFYNYFSSKNELLMAVFTMLYTNMEQKRNEILIGQDAANIDIFSKQIELQIKINRTNKLLLLFEEVIVSHDEELKQFIKRGHLRMLDWLYNRFVEIFGDNKKPYLYDCAIMFIGILHQNLKYYEMIYGPYEDLRPVVAYSVNRIANIVEEVSEKDEILLQYEDLRDFMPSTKNDNHDEIIRCITSLKKKAANDIKSNELLEFIEEELSHNKQPRKYVLESALTSLKGLDIDVSELVALIQKS
ncbi:TetR/AcrR family transcriptional regulator [Bacillus sp. HMF5848]|uniref:TetR/AcrR family transcriptional regulator n=1 Tax=Bacillus sp. HMF5848 TaxID=2495421 RepID=UPI000F773399|nr:TetR/AcrR family transcriptional regulator [Bacillus sp. HMF5848]RSK25936.1 TetR/AcrR family transcriptional regulator [Bacillus sp. HMF5848]